MKKNSGIQRGTILGLAAVLASATQAFAHHPMGGATPSTLMQGLLSGLGHPVIGWDHLAFIVAMGLLVGTLRLSLAAPLAFVVASSAGVLVCTGGWPLPFVETIVALSVALAGVLLVWGKSASLTSVTLPAAVFGMFHGYAFGEAVVGAEPTPVAAYLAGLAIVQFALIYGVAFVTRAMGALAGSLVPRLAGAVAMLAGVTLLLTN
jgi:urease accessory protein